MLRFVSNCKYCSQILDIPKEEEPEESCPKCRFIYEEAQNDTEFMSSLREAVRQKRNIALVSSGGTGKSFQLKSIVRQLQFEEMKMYEVIAPTGNAALNVSGITYHTIFGWRSNNGDKSGKCEKFFGITPKKIHSLSMTELKSALLRERRYKKQLLHIANLDVIIFDEFSMISAEHWESMQRICQAIKNSSSLFGGIQIIAFGDPFQMVPISGNFITKAESWRQMEIWDVLSPVYHRFTNDIFRDMTRIIRLGILPAFVENKLKERFANPDCEIMEVFFTNSEVNEANKNAYDTLDFPETIYQSTLTSKFSIIDNKKQISDIQNQEDELEQKNSCNYQEEIVSYVKKEMNAMKSDLKKIYGDDYMNLHLKPGARVYCTMNVKEKNSRTFLYTNGTSGVIKTCNPDSVELLLDDGREVLVEYKIRDQSRKVILSDKNLLNIKIMFKHIPLRLGYAITGHKLQGLTLEKIKINGKRLIRKFGIVYVVLSRCRSLENIYLSKFSLNKIAISADIARFFSKHYERELCSLYENHPDWFEDYQIMTNDLSFVGQISRMIFLMKNKGNNVENIINTENEEENSKQENDGVIMKKINDIKIKTLVSKRSGQDELRNWLLAQDQKCVITLEKLPTVLQAAHVRPYSSFECSGSGEAHHGNVMFLRADLHLLYDTGYFSFTNDGNILLSKSLADHPYYGQMRRANIPSFIDPQHLEWHRNNVFQPLL